MMSKKTKYAFKALIKLAKHHGEGPLLISEISESEQIPRKFLEGILLELRNAGFLKSKMGKGGGYYLAKSPDKINMAEIYRVVEGPIAQLPCASINYYERCEDCPDEDGCKLHAVALELREVVLQVMYNNTLAKILEKTPIKGSFVSNIPLVDS